MTSTSNSQGSLPSNASPSQTIPLLSSSSTSTSAAANSNCSLTTVSSVGGVLSSNAEQQSSQEEVLALKEQLQLQEKILHQLDNEFKILYNEKEMHKKEYLNDKKHYLNTIKKLENEKEELCIENEQLINENFLLNKDLERLKETNQHLSSDVFRLTEEINFNKERCLLNEHVNSEYLNLQKKYMTLCEQYQRKQNEIEVIQNLNESDRYKNEFEKDYEKIFDKQNKDLRHKLEQKLNEIEQLKENERYLETVVRDKDLSITELKQLLEKCKLNHSTYIDYKDKRLNGLIEINACLQREILFHIINFGSNDQIQRARKYIDNENEVFTDLNEPMNQQMQTNESNVDLPSSTSVTQLRRSSTTDSNK